jgi:DNA primase catalytic subunit
MANKSRGEAQIRIEGKERLMKFDFNALANLMDARDMSLAEFSNQEKIVHHISKPAFVRDAIYYGLLWADKMLNKDWLFSALTFDDFQHYMEAVMKGITSCMSGNEVKKILEEKKDPEENLLNGASEIAKSEPTQSE